MTVTCPICCSESNFLESYSRQKIIASLRNLIPDEGIDDCEFGDYRLFLCPNCGTEFSDPMVEPDGTFYTWATRSGACYPETRWEWSECVRQIELLKNEFPRETIELLDAGCGSGHFLRILTKIPGINAVGIDLNPLAVEACQTSGLKAICGNFEDVLSQQRFGVSPSYNVVTLWHVVEHVADPVGLLTQAKELLTDGGYIYFSVPLSPLSYEISWPDPLNGPPHHLTRWQVTSIQALARRLDMSLELAIPPADSFGLRLLRTLMLQSASPYAGLTRFQKSVRLLAFLCLRPWRPFIDGYRQLRRSTLDGHTLPDIAFARLKRN